MLLGEAGGLVMCVMQLKREVVARPERARVY